MKPLFFIDMDGVLSDWIRGVEILYADRVLPDTLKNAKNYEVHETLKISYGQLSNDIKRASEDDKFWLRLPILPWAKLLIRLFEFQGEDANAFIITAPWPGDFQCYAQKVRWCNMHLDIGTDRVIPFPHKHLLAGPNRFLIDDCPKKINNWILCGGKGILFPCAHNSAGELADPVGHVISKIQDHIPSFNS